jgi:hypothetical protein
MSSYLLDTTGNAAVTYGQGKYVASASSEFSSSFVGWHAFDGASSEWATAASRYNTSSPYNYIGSVTTVDTLGNVYAGEWAQIQLPVSVVLTSYYVARRGSTVDEQTAWWLLGSRDSTNWYLLDTRIGIAASAAGVTYTTSTTQAYTFFRYVMTTGNGSGQPGLATLTLNGTEEGICVTNDSKVGIGIANPQRSLEVAGDLVVGGTISGGAGMGQFRNRIINGDMRIAQRGTSATISSVSGGYYTVDRVSSTCGTSATAVGAQQTLTASDTPYQIGFKYSYRFTVATPITVPASTYIYAYTTVIEGYNIIDLNWGTSFGSPVTVSFWFRSNIPSGSQTSVQLSNYGFSPNTYSIRIPFIYINTNTWQYVTLTVPPPPNGSGWNNGNSGGIGFNISCMNYNTPGLSINSIANTWENTTTYNRQGLQGDYIWAQNAGNYIEFTGVQLEKGTVATPFEFRPFATELALCQRYFEKSFDLTTTPNSNVDATNSLIINTSNTGGAIYQSGFIWFKIPKRARGGTVNLYNPYITTAVNTILRAPGSTLDVSIYGSTSMINGIQVNMYQQTSALSYHVHYTYACEL